MHRHQIERLPYWHVVIPLNAGYKQLFQHEIHTDIQN
jgi:hypothetical protein